jgi:hypothetical protein
MSAEPCLAARRGGKLFAAGRRAAKRDIGPCNHPKARLFMALTAYEERAWREIEAELSTLPWGLRLRIVTGTHPHATVIVMSVLAALVAVACLQTGIVQVVAAAAAAFVVAGIGYAVRREGRQPAARD